MTKVLEILVSPTGETIVQTKGYVGGACRDASRFLEQALGARIQETLTAEFHQPAEAREQLRESG